MKKLLAATIAVAMMGLGLVVSAGAPAMACDYSGCIATSPTVKAPDAVNVGGTVKIKFSASGPGNVQPTGIVKIVIRKKGGGFKSKKFVPYTGGSIKVRSGKLAKKGTYVLTTTFATSPTSIFKGSKKKSTFKVR